MICPKCGEPAQFRGLHKVVDRKGYVEYTYKAYAHSRRRARHKCSACGHVDRWSERQKKHYVKVGQREL